MGRKKKRGSVAKTLLKSLVFLVVLCVAGYYIKSYLMAPVSYKYPEFGIDIPSNYPIHGIDVSKYQSVIDWEDVKSMNVQNIRINFAYIKATEGIDLVDEQFRRNWLETDDYGITKGAYHYFIAGESGKKQARNFINIVELKKGDLPPVLDIEKNNGINPAEMNKEIGEWLNAVEHHYQTTPIIYSNLEYYSKYIRGAFDEYPIWIAHYLRPFKPGVENWTFWQHSEKGRVDGIKNHVDFNVFSGDSLDFQELLVK